ncbi:hypothetical protein N7488_007763 [Penicillium malachiteum]|nr:hypothetical protein N7488_007763 [Penicillium malachiteum]
MATYAAHSVTIGRTDNKAGVNAQVHMRSVKCLTTGKGVQISFGLGSAGVTLKKHVVGAADVIAKKWHTYALKGYSNMYEFDEKIDKAALYFCTVSKWKALVPIMKV